MGLVVFLVACALALWLMVVVLISLLGGVASGDVRDPFTGEQVVPHAAD